MHAALWRNFQGGLILAHWFEIKSTCSNLMMFGCWNLGSQNIWSEKLKLVVFQTASFFCTMERGTANILMPLSPSPGAGLHESLWVRVPLSGGRSLGRGGLEGML